MQKFVWFKQKWQREPKESVRIGEPNQTIRLTEKSQKSHQVQSCSVCRCVACGDWLDSWSLCAWRLVKELVKEFVFCLQLTLLDLNPFSALIMTTRIRPVSVPLFYLFEPISTILSNNLRFNTNSVHIFCSLF